MTDLTVFVWPWLAFAVLVTLAVLTQLPWAELYGLGYRGVAGKGRWVLVGAVVLAIMAPVLPPNRLVVSASAVLAFALFILLLLMTLEVRLAGYASMPIQRTWWLHVTVAVASTLAAIGARPLWRSKRWPEFAGAIGVAIWLGVNVIYFRPGGSDLIVAIEASFS